MPNSQSLITNFFKPKCRKKCLLTDYFKPKQITKVLPTSNRYSYRHQYHYEKSRILNRNRQRADAVATRNGYFYCAEDNFTEFRVHTTIDRCVIVENEKLIIPAGTRVATATVDGDSVLEHISVVANFQRQGIGTSLIRFINAAYVPKSPSSW